MKEYCLVPQEDLDCLEQALKQLIDFFNRGSQGNMGRIYPESFTHITEPMKKLAHHKYSKTIDFGDPDDNEHITRP